VLCGVPIANHESFACPIVTCFKAADMLGKQAGGGRGVVKSGPRHASYLKHLHNVEKRLYFPQTFLSLDSTREMTFLN